MSTREERMKVYKTRRAVIEAFKKLLKERLPEGEFSMAQLSTGNYSDGYLVIHNGKGGLSKRSRFLNKALFNKQGWDALFTPAFAGVARTDPNYKDPAYLGKLLEIINTTWKEAIDATIEGVC